MTMTTENVNTLESIGVREFDPSETMKVLTHNLWIYFSWGVSKQIYTIGKDSDGWVKGIMLKVNGRKWKHFVLITLNGLDYYEVRLLDRNHKVVKVNNYDIEFTNLVNVIDSLIES
jgi:hypothetical protein